MAHGWPGGEEEGSGRTGESRLGHCTTLPLIPIPSRCLVPSGLSRVHSQEMLGTTDPVTDDRVLKMKLLGS